MNPEILYEDNDMLVAIKPQGMPSQPDKTGDEDLLSYLEAHCKQSLGLIHRLDRPVGGVMVFAKTKDAETSLMKQIQDGTLQKSYMAVLCGKVEPSEGTMIDYLKKNGRTNLSEVVSSNVKDAKKAILHYCIIAEKQHGEQLLSLVEIQLETGRHHQIRVQCASHGTPLLGDAKYNKEYDKRSRIPIGLWSYHLKGIHPRTKRKWEYLYKPDQEPFSFF